MNKKIEKIEKKTDSKNSDQKNKALLKKEKN